MNWQPIVTEEFDKPVSVQVLGIIDAFQLSFSGDTFWFQPILGACPPPGTGTPPPCPAMACACTLQGYEICLHRSSKDTLPKFNRSPLKIGRNPEWKVKSSNFQAIFFQGRAGGIIYIFWNDWWFLHVLAIYFLALDAISMMWINAIEFLQFFNKLNWGSHNSSEILSTPRSSVWIGVWNRLVKAGANQNSQVTFIRRMVCGLNFILQILYRFF